MTLAADKPDQLAKMLKMAEQAHEEVQEGEFHDRDIHERDRQAKFGFRKLAAKPRTEQPTGSSWLGPRREAARLPVSAVSRVPMANWRPKRSMAIPAPIGTRSSDRNSRNIRTVW